MELFAAASSLPSQSAASQSAVPQPGAPAHGTVGEVVESSTRQFVAEVGRDARPPAFGAWVEVEVESGERLYGLVSHIETGSLEPGRRAVALGLGREELRREMPQLQELIRTTFRAQVLAYREAPSGTRAGTLRQTLPPLPPALHDFARLAPADAVAALHDPDGSFDYLRTLARHPDPAVPADDLIAAALRQAYDAFGRGERGQAVVVAAGRSLARLLNDDHERLQSILRRVG